MVEKLRVLFERLVAELPRDTARVNIYRVPKGDGTVIELLLTNRDSASFAVHVDDEGIGYLDFSFGRHGDVGIAARRKESRGKRRTTALGS